MDRKKVAQIAAQAASKHVSYIIENPPRENVSESALPTAYYQAMTALLKEMGITPTMFYDRVDAYARKKASNPADIGAISGNMLKEVARLNMGQKVFNRIIEALFPADEDLSVQRVSSKELTEKIVERHTDAAEHAAAVKRITDEK